MMTMVIAPAVAVALAFHVQYRRAVRQLLLLIGKKTMNDSRKPQILRVVTGVEWFGQLLERHPRTTTQKKHLLQYPWCIEVT